MRRLFVAVALALGLAPATLAVTPPAEGVLGRLRADVRTVRGDLALTLRDEVAPTTRARSGYLAALGASSYALERRKESLRDDVLRSDLFADSGWTEVGGQLGLSRNVELFAAGLYVGGLAAPMPRVRETGLLLGESLLAAQTGSGLLNYTFGERRPQDGGELRYFQRGGHAASIHVTNTVALARVLDHQLMAAGRGGRALPLLRAAVYAIPAVTAWQRLRADQHFLWNDVLGGGASLYMTNAVLRAHDRRTPETPAVPAPSPSAAAPAAGEGLRSDLRAFVLLPRTASAHAWSDLGLGMLAVGAVAAFDQNLESSVDASETASSERLARDLRPLGQEGGLALMAGAWGLGQATHHERVARIGEDGLEASFLSAGIVVPALKALSGRSRPRNGEDSRSFHLFSGGESFPSGEAAQAFAIASVVATHAQRRWVKAAAYGLAATVALGRTEVDAHWTSDILAGGLIGAGIGRWVAHRHPLPVESETPAPPRWTLVPALSKDRAVLYLGWSR